MDNTQVLLNGMPIAEFVQFYIVAMIGVLFFFIGRVYGAINLDKSTPFEWSWRHFMRGFIKLIGTLVIVPLGIVYFKDFAPWVLDLGEGGVAELNGKSALLWGMGADAAVQKIFKAINSGKQITNMKFKRQANG
jgi:uncharacterized membrane protein